MTKTISFSVSNEDRLLIEEIAYRAVRLFGGKLLPFEMDLTAVHANGNPLDLAMLKTGDDFNFAHDILGIRQHLDRTTGKLQNCFVPRYSSR